MSGCIPCPIDVIPWCKGQGIVFIRMGVFGESPKFEVFLGKNPKIPQKLRLSPTPINPQDLFGDFWGFIPKKTKFYAQPCLQKVPKIFPMLIPVPAPSPKFRDGDGENRGLGPRFPTLVRIPDFPCHFWGSLTSYHNYRPFLHLYRLKTIC